MKALKCEYCGGAIDRNSMSCPFCGTDYINDNETVDTVSEEDARTEWFIRNFGKNTEGHDFSSEFMLGNISGGRNDRNS